MFSSLPKMTIFEIMEPQLVGFGHGIKNYTLQKVVNILEGTFVEKRS